MSQQIGVLDLTFTAGEDLTTAQYKAVYLSADNTVSLCTTAHVDAIGILQNEPDSGEAALVRVLGTTKVMVGEAIEAGKRVYVDTDAMVMEENAAAQTEVRLIGIMLSDADADGDIAEVFLQHFSFVKGAA
jgi:hypothetical protein